MYTNINKPIIGTGKSIDISSIESDSIPENIRSVCFNHNLLVAKTFTIDLIRSVHTLRSPANICNITIAYWNYTKKAKSKEAIRAKLTRLRTAKLVSLKNSVYSITDDGYNTANIILNSDHLEAKQHKKKTTTKKKSIAVYDDDDDLNYSCDDNPSYFSYSIEDI